MPRPRPANYAFAGLLPEPYEIVDRPLWWHTRGLTQTASGYGNQLTSARKVRLPNGREFRIYITQWSNAGTAWVTMNGKKYTVRETA